MIHIELYQQFLQQLEEKKPAGWKEILRAEKESDDYKFVTLDIQAYDLRRLMEEKKLQYETASAALDKQMCPFDEKKDVVARIDQQTRTITQILLVPEFAESLKTPCGMLAGSLSEYREAEANENRVKAEIEAEIEKSGGHEEFRRRFKVRLERLADILQLPRPEFWDDTPPPATRQTATPPFSSHH